MAFIEKKKRKSKGRSSYGEYAWIVRYRDLTGREKQATFNRRDDANRARIAIERARVLAKIGHRTVNRTLLICAQLCWPIWISNN